MASYNVDLTVADADYVFAVAVELGGDGTSVAVGTSVVLRFRWLDQITAWSMRIETPDGAELSQHDIAREGAWVTWDTSDTAAPVGTLQWVGRDPQVKSDLGTRLQLVWTEP